MSRIGKKHITLPPGVTAAKDGRVLVITGPKGSLEHIIRPEIDIEIKGNELIAKPAIEGRSTSKFWGLTRALIAGMVEGVSHGFEKKLEIEGIGYRASMDGSNLTLALGFSHPVKVAAPPGITFRVEKNTITVLGIDKALVGDTAANIRHLRPPEPYKGKGIRYLGEVIRRKAGKKAVTTAT